MTAINYNDLVNTLASLLPVDSPSNANFQLQLPNIINDGELRIYRDLDLLDTSTMSTTTLTAGNRNLTLPTVNGTPIVTDQINIITPVATQPSAGTRNPVTPASLELLDALWPSVNGSAVPTYWAQFNQDLVVFGPWPDQAYIVEVIHTIRPDQISSTNVTTLLSTFYPDLLISACMVYGSAFQQNFGRAVDDPKMAMTWESHYQTQLEAAKTEEARKTFTSVAWSSKEPSPLVTPPRT